MWLDLKIPLLAAFLMLLPSVAHGQPIDTSVAEAICLEEGLTRQTEPFGQCVLDKIQIIREYEARESFQRANKLASGIDWARSDLLAIRNLEKTIEFSKDKNLIDDAEALLAELKFLEPFGGLPGRLYRQYPAFSKIYKGYEPLVGHKALVVSLKFPYHSSSTYRHRSDEEAEQAALNHCRRNYVGPCITVAVNYEYLFPDRLREHARGDCPKNEIKKEKCATAWASKTLSVIKKRIERSERGPSGLSKALSYVFRTAGQVLAAGLSSGAFSDAYSTNPPSPGQSFVNGARAGQQYFGAPPSPTLEYIQTFVTSMEISRPPNALGRQNSFGLIRKELDLGRGYTSCVYSNGSTSVTFHTGCSVAISANPTLKSDRILGFTGQKKLVHEESLIGSGQKVCVYADGSSKTFPALELCPRLRLGW